jgi:hypothetical protein
MRDFIVRFFVFSSILLVFCIVGLLLPPTPRSLNSALFSKRQRDLLLRTTKGPRIILIGGSNIGFGIASYILRDKLQRQPINYGNHVNLGLMYMLADVAPYVQKEDIVILAPEYIHYYGRMAYGREELLRTVIDVDGFNVRGLSWQQINSIYRFLPKYCLQKFFPNEYFNVYFGSVYIANSLNSFGDVISHWNQPQPKSPKDDPSVTTYNTEVMPAIESFAKQVTQRGGYFLITFPGIQENFFNQIREQAQYVYQQYKERNFCILGYPERYIIPDTMIFDTVYHLTKAGMEYRTNLLLADLATQKLANCKFR